MAMVEKNNLQGLLELLCRAPKPKRWLLTAPKIATTSKSCNTVTHISLISLFLFIYLLLSAQALGSTQLTSSLTHRHMQ